MILQAKKKSAGKVINLINSAGNTHPTPAQVSSGGLLILKSLLLKEKSQFLELTALWRRRRDLNPCAREYPAYRISSADPSTTWVLLQDIEL